MKSGNMDNDAEGFYAVTSLPFQCPDCGTVLQYCKGVAYCSACKRELSENEIRTRCGW